MSTSNFASDSKTISAPQRNVYEKLSDMGNLEKMAAHVPSDKLKDIKIEDGCLSFPTMMGEISLKMSEATPYDSIRYASVKSPVPFSLNIKLSPAGARECNITLEAELGLSSFLMGMAQRPVTDALNRIAEALTMINY